jgi:5'-nucleotidase
VTTGPSNPTSAAASTTPTPTPSATLRAITVLVMNDDGVHAPGINAIVQALRKESGVTIKVVGPATNQSGKGGTTTPGTVTYTNTTTTSGYPAVAVNGTPADSANVAFDQLHLKPDVVISGANAGQNLGPIVDLSGTVGAARVAATKGVPSLAVSAGFAATIDYATATQYAMDWFHSERPLLPATPSTSPSTVAGLNVPTCTTAKVRGELKLRQQLVFGPGESALGASNCASTATPTMEVAAFTDGFATLVPLPLTPR